ncbi:MAG: hypothetical protein L3J62_08400 [Gammaproteobacteria bacterium]|nr:hypothetical protein [Gammaproteobacteria bacterium]
MNRYIFTVVLFVVFLMPASGAFADKLPAHYPESFNNIGTIDDLRKDAIMINDLEFSVSPATRVYTPHSRFSSLRVLKIGSMVGFSIVEKGEAGIRQVSEIWVLPERFNGSGSEE